MTWVGIAVGTYTFL